MRQVNAAADRAISTFLLQQGGLITRRQALSAGMSEAALRHRTRVGGPWRPVLSGIYLNSNGPLTAGQREIAAVMHAGRDCVITGFAALEQQGVRVPPTGIVDVLVPASVNRHSEAFVRVQRTAKLPEWPLVRGGIRWAPAARAVADATRGELDFRDVRSLVAEAVQRRTCTIGQLAQELRAGPRRGSSLLRAALEEVADGVASVTEGDLRKLIKNGRLPEPMYNPKLFVGSDFLGQPDVWWRDAGVAGEVDSREWHISPDLWARTLARHAKMSALGIIVLHFTPSRIRGDSAQVVSELRSAIQAGRQRAELEIRTVAGH